MINQTDKRIRAAQFRDRVHLAMQHSDLTQSALSRLAGVDRSTLSQLLKGDGARMPGGQLVAECAAALGVSADWLLGLSDYPQQASDLLAGAMAMPRASRALIDDAVLGWHQEAAGYKIRHVPAALPDMLKTGEMLQWEHHATTGRSSVQALEASQARIALMQQGGSDYEIALPGTELEIFARAQGHYTGIAADIRRDQLRHMMALHDRLYPKLRLHLYDLRQIFSAPLSVYGPLLASIYLGHSYIVFRDTDRVQAITHHFDQLVRAATVAPADMALYLKGLLDLVD